MATWSQFAGDYLFEVTGCSTFQAERALRHAAREFCERTLAHRLVLDSIPTVAGVSSYDYDPASNLEVVKLLSATLDGQDMELLDPSADLYRRGIKGLSPFEFMLQPAPSAGQSVLVTAAVKPSSTASTIESRLYESHAMSIAAGAKAILFSQSDQPYSNMEQALKNRAQFESDIGSIAAKAAQGFSRAPLRTVASFM